MLIPTSGAMAGKGGVLRILSKDLRDSLPGVAGRPQLQVRTLAERDALSGGEACVDGGGGKDLVHQEPRHSPDSGILTQGGQAYVQMTGRAGE